MTETIDDLLWQQPFVFRDRPTPAPSDLRPVWRVPVVVLLISHCRQQQATHEQLHVLNWAIRTADTAEVLCSFLAGDIPPERAIVRMEPALDRAVALAHGFKLIAWSAKKAWILTPAGHEVLSAINEDPEMLAREKLILAGLPKPLTKSAVTTLLRRDPS